MTFTREDLEAVAKMVWEHMVPRHRLHCSTCEGDPTFIVDIYLATKGNKK